MTMKNFNNIKLNFKIKTFKLKDEFKISRLSKKIIKVIDISLKDSVNSTTAECVPYQRYNEKLDDILEYLRVNKDKVEKIIINNEIKRIPFLRLQNALSTSINTNSDIINLSSNKTQIAYFLPAMGGFTAGASMYDSGTNVGTDSTEIGARYTMDAGGNTITLGAATGTTEAATKDTDSQNMGVKVVSGNLSFIVSNGTYEAVDEDRSAQGIAASYKMANGVILGAFTLSTEDDLDVGEEYSASGVEAQYVIAPGLTAVVGVTDYEYTKSTGTVDSGMSSLSDSGTTTALTIKATF